MSILTSLDGQSDLPRYFSNAFQTAQKLSHGRLDMILPDGRVFRAEGAHPGPVAEFTVHNEDLFARLVREGDLGFSDAYLEGWWTTPDLQAFMDLVHTDNDEVYDGYPGMALIRAYERLRFWMQGNSKTQARKNISYHYDLGNEFYGLWLDDTMTYSSALFKTGQESLEKAQEQKYASMVDQMGVSPGDHVLEIGCGWGGFAEYAAKERGLRVTGLTISREQHDYAVARMARLGLSDMVDIKMQDYRDETGQYDGIASIEMFEAVGEKYWPVYFQTVRDRLKPGKSATLQIITVDDSRWEIYKRGVDFIQKYIFPGGMLPSPTVLRAEIAKAGLSLKGSIEFGQSYSQTLRRWHETFNDRWEDVAGLNFDQRFRNMWNFYLTSCASAFASGNCDLTQITMKKPELSKMPTAAKLVAAIVLALTGFLAAQAVQPFMPDGQRDKWLYQASILIPIVCAWRTIGRMVGKSYWSALNTGFYGMFVSVFFVLLAFASGEMIIRSLRLRYDGPMEAIVSMFGIAVEYGALLLNPPVLAVLIIGGAVAGLGAEWTNRRWA